MLLGIPPEYWPAEDAYEEFKKHISVEQFPLIVDVGQEVLKTTSVTETSDQ